jgi:hypothetical protein
MIITVAHFSWPHLGASHMKDHHKSPRLKISCPTRLRCLAVLALSASLSAADEQTAPQARSMKPAAMARAPASEPTIAGTARRTAAPSPGTAPVAIRDLPAYQFQDTDTLATRLAGMRSLAVMTVWQSRRTKIYLGLDQKGRAGLHLCQRSSASGTGALWERPAKSELSSSGEAAPAALRTVSP